MCTVTAMDNVRKAYDEYHYSSDCFDFRTDARLEKMIYLIKGTDELSNKIASEIRGKHSFYSTYTIASDLCAAPTAEQIQDLIVHIQGLNLQGSGMLIANKYYYSRLIEVSPSFIHTLALIRPDYDTDYIQLMVDFNIGRHYASRVKVLKEKNAAKVGVSNYYKNIMPFDVLVLPAVESLRSLVSAAYIYQEIKLRYNITPKVYVQCSVEVNAEKELAEKLLSALCVEDINFIKYQDTQTLSEVVSNRRVLFVTPQRCSLKKYHDVEKMRKELKFSPRFYVVKENLDELLSGSEYWKKQIFKDICNSLNVAEQTEEVMSLRESLEEKIKEETVSLTEELSKEKQQEEAISCKIEELIEKHHAYLKHLFKI